MDKANYVLDRYIQLYWIKNRVYWTTNIWFIEKLKKYTEKANLVINDRATEQSDYRTFVSRAVSDQQKADMLENSPIYDYIWLDKDSNNKIFAIKEVWKYWWKIDELDRKIFDVVSDSCDYWTWILYQGWKIEDRNVSMPIIKDWSLIFKNKDINQYTWVYSEYIPLEDFFIDWTTIENSNEAVWRRHWDREEFIKSFEFNSDYKNLEKIPSNDVYFWLLEWLPTIKQVWFDLIQELRYYNKSEDKLIILANWIEVYSTPIPHLHKELPFCPFNNHQYRNRFIQMWNYELLEEHERYMNSIRSQSIDITKANIWFNLVDRNSDFNPEWTRNWVDMFYDIDDVNSLKRFSANINTDLGWLEAKAWDDVISLSGIDYRNQSLQWASETAKRTSSRNAAQQKRINLILKKNSFNFYNRLAKLRLADIQLIHSMKNFEIPLKWLDVTWDEFTNVQNWYWTFTITPELVKWKFNIILQTESLLWNSTEKEKEELLNFFQVFWNLTDEAWKRIINPNRMVEIAWIKIWVDVDTLMEKDVVNKSWKDIIGNIDAQDNWQDLTSNTPSNPNFIPPENRANVHWWVNVIWWGNTSM
jgi:hypothetical protein